MMNRNQLMIKNMLITVGFSVLNFILGIYEVRLFLNAYGDVINGLIQTGNQALSYIALFESGICAAFLYHLYKPIGENNYNRVSSLYKGFKRSMLRVTYMMMVAAIGICAIMPLIIRDKTIPYVQSFAILSLISVRFIAPYAVSLAPKYMLIAREKKYKAEIIDGLKQSLVYAFDIIVLLIWNPSIYVLLAINAIIVVGIGFLSQVLMNREYWGMIYREVEPDFTPTKMSKDLLAHNISGLAFNSSANIVLASLSPSLMSATIYSSYNKLISNIVSMGQKIVEGANASVGVKISRNDSNVYCVFREIVSCSQFFSSVIVITLIVCINSFIELWIGAEYTVDLFCVVMFCLVIYEEIMQRSYFVARNAKGLFKESRNFTIIQAAVNIVISLALTPSLGVAGVLIGIMVGRFFISIPCNYRLVYQKVFQDERARWWELVTSPLLIIVVGLVFNLLADTLTVGLSNQFSIFLCRGIIGIVGAIIICSVYQLITDKWFKFACKRFGVLFRGVVR